MKHQKRVAILYGGKSAEHEVSLQSALNVYNAIDKEKFEPVLISIDKEGAWRLKEDILFLKPDGKLELTTDANQSGEISFVPGQKINPLRPLAQNKTFDKIDVVFPVLHGPYGEDGSVQGFLKLAGLPCVGAGILGSALGMDKVIMKKLFREAGIPTADFLYYQSYQRNSITFEEVVDVLGVPFFVKPANLGSSVGISKVSDKGDFAQAIHNAFQFDRKIIIEEFVDGREIEVAVIGNNNPTSSIPGEILCNKERAGFYSYEAKYIDEHGAMLEIPAKLSPEKQQEVQDLAAEVFTVLCCEGMARVDFFLMANGEFLVNEINTIPGFTSVSMYPMLWEASGKNYKQLITELIELAMERFEEEQQLKSSL